METASSEELGERSTTRSPGRRSAPPKQPLALRLWGLLQPLARLWGLITAVVMSGAGSQLLVLGRRGAVGLLVGSACVLILETMWVAALFVDVLCRRGEYTLPLRCWDFARWSCGRARAPLYACAATALLFADITLFATISGGMLLVLATLRAAVPFSPFATHGPHSPRAGSSLLSQLDSPLPDVFYSQAAKDRCEEMTVLDLKVPERPRSASPKPPLLEL
ncbi:hypothetical protein MSG28_002823 [Choristoneura fumiferana]|uniref:Uncharacterized protein n=1 Tax=Choristoneura fumiferana TaxID=7141 RepID=A0ACC0JJH3_CHOFU|nr:hypothetical protein MSG28_002823 [Choristoneura fumiferana]